VTNISLSFDLNVLRERKKLNYQTGSHHLSLHSLIERLSLTFSKFSLNILIKYIMTDNKNNLNREIVQSIGDSNVNNDQNSAKLNNVQFNNSSEIQMGARIIYNGPVTISSTFQSESKVYDCRCFKITEKTLKRVLSAAAIVVVIVLIFALILLSLFLTNTHDSKKRDNDIKLKSPPNLGKYRFYTREDWNATLVEPYFQLIHPIKRIIITHTDMRPCYTEVKEREAREMR
jgi:hypothetical protein